VSIHHRLERLEAAATAGPRAEAECQGRADAVLSGLQAMAVADGITVEPPSRLRLIDRIRRTMAERGL
jgi:hypothetical protein